MPPSSLHSNVAFGSLEEKSKFADVEVVVPDGPEVMLVVGAAVSIVNDALAGVWSVPVTLNARTWNV